LRAIGHEAALLDGGLSGYLEDDGGRLDRDEPQRPPRRFSTRPWPPDLLAGIEDATDPAYVVLDAREPERYRGRSSRWTRGPPHPRGTEPALPREPRRGRPVPAGRRPARAVRGTRRHRRGERRVVLRLGGDGLSQPDRAGVGRLGRGPALRRLVVAVRRRPRPPGGHRCRAVAGRARRGGRRPRPVERCDQLPPEGHRQRLRLRSGDRARSGEVAGSEDVDLRVAERSGEADWHLDGAHLDGNAIQDVGDGDVHQSPSDDRGLGPWPRATTAPAASALAAA